MADRLSFAARYRIVGHEHARDGRCGRASRSARTEFGSPGVVAALENLAGSVPFERDVEAAWRTFAAARASYEPYALALAAFILLPQHGWLRPLAPAA